MTYNAPLSLLFGSTLLGPSGETVPTDDVLAQAVRIAIYFGDASGELAAGIEFEVKLRALLTAVDAAGETSALALIFVNCTGPISATMVPAAIADLGFYILADSTSFRSHFGLFAISVPELFIIDHNANPVVPDGRNAVRVTSVPRALRGHDLLIATPCPLLVTTRFASCTRSPLLENARFGRGDITRARPLRVPAHRGPAAHRGVPRRCPQDILPRRTRGLLREPAG
jgi:hypothetical protein